MVRERRDKESTTTRTGSLSAGGTQALDWLATAVVVISTAVAVILALHIVFVVFDANEANPLVTLVEGVAQGLAWLFKDLFVPENERARVIVNYGLAALVYLVLGQLLAKLLRRS